MAAARQQATVAAEVARYRAGMADLLAGSVSTTRDLERSFGDAGGVLKATAQADLEADSTAPFRNQCAVLVRKARLHADAVLRANAANNPHSLAVQMRPVLECAGQVVFICDNLLVSPGLTTKPESAARALAGRVNAGYYGTIIRATRGKVGHEELLARISEVEEAAAQSVRMRKPQKRQRGSLKQAAKVAVLEGGAGWYAHLSEHFCHGDGTLRGHTWRGGVGSTNTWQAALAFAGFMDYLVEQVGSMNAYAALFPVTGDDGKGRVEATLGRLREGRATSADLRRAAMSAMAGVNTVVED